MSTPITTQFKTPDGVRFATHINGAHVIGDTLPTPRAIEALSELVEVASKHFQAHILETALTELGFEKCEFPPDDDACECCNKSNLQLYFQGPTDAGRYFCAACVIAEQAANDNYAPVAN